MKRNFAKTTFAMKNAFPLIILLLTFGGLSAQNCILPVDAYEINEIADDAQYIYTATQSNGLTVTAKSVFSTDIFDAETSNLPSNTLLGVAVRQGQVYVSTDSEILVLDDDNFTIFNLEAAGRLLVTQAGNLAVAGHDYFYLLNADGDVIYTQDLTELMPNQCCPHISDIHQDADGNIWLAHWDFYQYGVFKFDGAEWAVFNSENSDLPIESPENTNCVTSINNRVFANQFTGEIYEYDGADWEILHSSAQPEIPEFADINEFVIEADDYNILWVGSNSWITEEASKLAYKQGNIWEYLNLPLSHSEARLSRLHKSAVDPNEMYVGTNIGLLVIYKDCLGVLPNEVTAQAVGQLNLSPNPVTDKLQLPLPATGTFSYILTDGTGRPVREGTVNTDRTLEVGSLPAGVYLLQTKNAEGVFVGKFYKAG